MIRVSEIDVNDAFDYNLRCNDKYLVLITEGSDFRANSERYEDMKHNFVFHSHIWIHNNVLIKNHAFDDFLHPFGKITNDEMQSHFIKIEKT